MIQRTHETLRNNFYSLSDFDSTLRASVLCLKQTQKIRHRNSTRNSIRKEKYQWKSVSRSHHSRVYYNNSIISVFRFYNSWIEHLFVIFGSIFDCSIPTSKHWASNIFTSIQIQWNINKLNGNIVTKWKEIFIQCCTSYLVKSTKKMMTKYLLNAVQLFIITYNYV